MNETDDEELIRQLNRLGDVQPSPEATLGALDRVREALTRSAEDISLRRKRIMWKSVTVTAGTLVGMVSLLLVWVSLPQSVARAGWSEVQAAMNSHRSATWRQVIRVRGQPDDISRFLLLEDGRSRCEQADGNYTIIDAEKHRQLLVEVRNRRATLYEGAWGPPANLYEIIKNSPRDTSARSLPGKKIEGQDVLGFVVKVTPDVEGSEITVWADAKTRLPVRMEQSYQPSPSEPAGEVIFDEYEFDKELNPKLFSFDPPAGYQFETKGNANFPDAPTDPQLKELVVTPLEGIGRVKFRVSREEVEKLLGKPDGVNQPVPGGLAILDYGSRGFYLHVSPKMGLLLIMCVSEKIMATRVRDFAGKTDKGIGLGASKAEIIKAYGEPTSHETSDGTTSLSYSKLRAEFTIFEDKLVQMMFNRP